MPALGSRLKGTNEVRVKLSANDEKTETGFLYQPPSSPLLSTIPIDPVLYHPSPLTASRCSEFNREV